MTACVKKYYTLVISVLDEARNRLDAHDVSGSNDEKFILSLRDKLADDIKCGKYRKLERKNCTLRADIEVRDDNTYALLYII